MKKNKSAWLYGSIGIIILISAIIAGLDRAAVAIFMPYNGDFQNYNGVIRLLSGQAPFGDFIFHLGFGPLYITSLLVAIHNTFNFSLFITNFLSNITYALGAYVIALAVSNNKKVSGVTAGIAYLVASPIYKLIEAHHSNVVICKLYYKIWYVNNRLQIEPSYRTVREAVVIFALILMIQIFNKESWLRKKVAPLKFYQKAILTGAVAGILMLWSTDFGIPVYVGIAFIYFLWMVSSKKFAQVVYGTAIYISVSAVAFFVGLTLLTWGHPMGWFEYMAGTNAYQFWYTGARLSEKVFLLTMVNHHRLLLVAILLFGILTLRVMFNKKGFDAVRTSVVFCFLLCVYLFGGYLYSIRYFGNAIFVAMAIVFGIAILALLIKWTAKFLKGQWIRTTVLIVIVLGLCAGLVYDITDYVEDKRDVESNDGFTKIDGLGYNDFGEALLLEQELVEDKSFFSLYPSALNYMTGRIQDTNADYIIHIQGDEARKEYIEQFKAGNYDYVFAVRLGLSDWIVYANWYFYRELYMDYELKWMSGFNAIWVKDAQIALEVDTEAYEISYTQPYDNQVMIDITSDNKEGHVADVFVSYESFIDTFNGGNIVLNQCVNAIPYLYVPETGEYDETYGNFLPAESEGVYIPVFLNEGKGQMKLLLNPEGKITLNDLELVHVFTQDRRGDIPEITPDDVEAEKAKE